MRRWWAYVCLVLGALVLAAAVVLFGFGRAILNGYAKPRMERAYAQAYPRCVLRIGELEYNLGANRLVARSVSISGTNTTLKTGRISLTGSRWWRLVWGSGAVADVLGQASLEATNLTVEFSEVRYVIHCQRVRASVPDSELVTEGVELRTSVEDEAFFAASDFRTTRFHLVVPECRVMGLEYGELLRRNSYRAQAILLSRPSFDALVNRDKPAGPLVQPPLMVGEALAVIAQPLHIDRLTITNGEIKYGERLVVGAAPGVLTFGAVNMSVEGLANRGEPSAVLRLRAQGDFMNAGVLKVLMTIPVISPDVSLHYSGSLGAMDLTRLGAFLDTTEHTRISSGSAEEATFEINVIAGRARGHVRAIYRNLKVAFLDQETGSAKGVGNRVKSFLANTLKVRDSNVPDTTGALKLGEVNYTKTPEDEFLQFVWYALRSGVVDVISH